MAHRSKNTRAILLELDTGQTIENPSDLQIEHALRSMPAESSTTASLTRGAKAYIEAAGSVSEGFFLEYRTSAAHYRSTDTALGLTDVITAFQAFGRGDAQRLKQLSWIRERPVIRYGTLLLGGAVLFIGTVLHVRLLQAAGLMLETFAFGLWAWTGLRAGEIYVPIAYSGSYCSREREPVGYWVLMAFPLVTTAAGAWLTVAVLRGVVTFP